MRNAAPFEKVGTQKKAAEEDLRMGVDADDVDGAIGVKLCP